MRIIRLNLNRHVAMTVRNVARRFRIDDSGFAEDIYSLLRLKGNGLPTQARIKFLAKKMADADKQRTMGFQAYSLLIGKRKMIMQNLIALPYFHALATLSDPINALDRLLQRMKLLYAKSRQSKCMTCALLKDCAYGQTYSSVADIKQVIDADYKDKIHKDCPDMPSVDAINQVALSIKALVDIAKANAAGAPEAKVAANSDPNSYSHKNPKNSPLQPEDFEGEEDNETAEAPTDLTSSVGSGQGGDADVPSDFHIPGLPAQKQEATRTYTGVHDADTLCQIHEKTIDELTAQQLVIFDLGRKFALELDRAKSGKFKPTDESSDSKQAREMERPSDVTRLVASQHGLPDEVFNSRLEQLELQKRKNVIREDKRKILYLLIDNSASMQTFLPPQPGCNVIVNNGTGLFTRVALAQLLCLALCRQVEKDKGWIFNRMFSTGLSSLRTAKNAQEFQSVCDYIASASARSGGTNIVNAIKVATEDIRSSTGDVKHSEILVVTDCEDDFSAAEAKSAAGGIEVNVLDVSGGGSQLDSVKQALKSIATRYYLADNQAVSLKNIVNLI